MKKCLLFKLEAKLQLGVNQALLSEQLLTGEKTQRTKGTIINQLLDWWEFSVLIISCKHYWSTAGLVLLLAAHWWKTLMSEASLSLVVAIQFCGYKPGWEQSQTEYTRVTVWYICLCSSAVNSLQCYQSWLFTAHKAEVNQLHVGDISGGFREAGYTPRLWHNCFTAVQVV